MNTKIKELTSFHYAFQISKLIVFEVQYYRLSNNKSKYFATQAAMFNRPKTDYIECGQAQKSLLKEAKKAMQFYKKWDYIHIKDLNEQQHAEMLIDIEELCNQYNFIHKETDFSFEELKGLSKMKIK
jgi:hypothetical protein